MITSGVGAVARWTTWSRVRRAAVALYLIFLGLSLARNGIPLDHAGQYVWIIAGLGTLSIGRPWRVWVRLFVSWTLFFGVFVAYDYSRGMAYHYTGPVIGGYPAQGAINTLGMPLHITFPIRFDEFMFGGTLPTHWMQEHLHPGHAIPIIAIIVSLTYLSHFLVTPLIAIVLWVRRSQYFTTWIAMALGLALVGLTGYFLYPMSPPWLASQQGYIRGAPVMGLVGEGWQYLGIKFAESLITDGRGLANPVAAMPSLHLAYSTLAAGFMFFVTQRRWLRVVVWAYPLTMGASLVYGGEHYVTDELFGALAAAVVLAIWRFARAQRTRSRAGSGATIEPLRQSHTPQRDALSATNADEWQQSIEHTVGRSNLVRRQGLEPRTR